MCLGCLCPHLADILEDQVHVTIEGLHAPQYLTVVSAVDQHLGVRLHCLGKERQRPLVEGVFLRRVLLFRFTCIGHL